METLDELKAIRDNAPEGSTHVGADMEYIKWVEIEGLYFNYGHKHSVWHIMETQDIEVMRSLSDIKQIIELMEINQNMHTTVAGYLYGKDWAHWNEFNAGKYKL